MRRLLSYAAVAGITAWSTGCIWIVHQVDVAQGPARGDSAAVKVPVKVQMLDGTIVMFRSGVTIARDTLRGDGSAYDRTITSWHGVTRVPRDSVAAMEFFNTSVNESATWIWSGASTVALAGLVFAIGASEHPIGPIFTGSARAVHP